MNKWMTLQIIVEGLTEQNFVNDLLVDYLAQHNIAVHASQVSKPQQKGGDIRFERVKTDVLAFLRQRNDIIVSTFVDYYGLHQWPGLEEISFGMSPSAIADKLNGSAVLSLAQEYPELRVPERFIPYLSMHEFEALLFSDTEVLSEELNTSRKAFEDVLADCGSPEQINTVRETSPSHRLKALSQGRYKKSSTDIRIAKRIGIERIRVQCPIFDAWLKKIEQLATK